MKVMQSIENTCTEYPKSHKDVIVTISDKYVDLNTSHIQG